MSNPRSIKQNNRPDVLPNFRNLGIMLRVLIISNGLAILLAVLQANSWAEVGQHLLQISTLLTPVLLSSLVLLWIAQPWLNKLPYKQGVIVMTTSVMALTLVIDDLGGRLYNLPGSTNYYFDEMRYVLLSALVCFILLLYFRIRSRLLSRALHEARLQVLRARIRPHFLFNTINAVLGIVRTQPKQAEAALEDMADLFRMAMSDARDLVPLHREIQLCKQYIALEKLRMGERLSVGWEIQDVPENALIPPLLLQPLLENAVYHGIELLPQGGTINIAMKRNGDELRLIVENPCVPQHSTAGGANKAGAALTVHEMEKGITTHAGRKIHTNNKMALQNIRERLDLLFDAEARYQVENGKNFYRVEIVLPYVKERPS